VLTSWVPTPVVYRDPSLRISGSTSVVLNVERARPRFSRLERQPAPAILSSSPTQR
jgi:hypothetical protein